MLSGSVLQVVNLVAAAVASFFLMPFIVHHLGDRIYGFWSLATAFIGYYNLLDLGLSSAITQYMCVALGEKNFAECRVVFNTALRLQILIGGAALAVTLALVVATPLFCHHPADVPIFRSAIAILGINAAIGFPARVYWAALGAKLRFDIQSGIAILGTILRTGFIVATIWGGGGLLALAWTALLATLPLTALQIWYAQREASWTQVDNQFVQTKKVRSFFSYSAYSFLSYIADLVRFQLDPIVISGMIGLAAVTHYKVAGVLAQYYVQIIYVTIGMLSPVFSRLHGMGNTDALERAFSTSGTKMSCCLSVFIFAALVGWGKPFIARWMGPNYEDGYLPMVVLSFAVLLVACQHSSADLLFSTFKHKGYAWINCAEAILNLGFSLALVKPLGILGVAMGTLIGAFVIRIIVQPWWVCKVSGIHYAKYMGFLGGNLLRSGCLAGGSIAIVAWGLRPSYAWLALSAICATAVYAVGSWLMVLDRHDREQFKAALRKGSTPEALELVGVGESTR